MATPANSPAADSTAAGASEPMAPVKESRVISVFGPKGGVGTTVIAANLAAAIRALLEVPIALIELNSPEHDAMQMLGSSTVHCVPHEVTTANVAALVQERRKVFAYVIIDAGSLLSDVAVSAFERSNLILLVTTPDVVALQHTLRAIEQLDALKFPMRMLRVVINRAESHGSLRQRDVKDQLPVPVIAEIGSDGRLMGFAVNQGAPIVLAKDGGRVKEALKRFAKAVVETPELFVQQVIMIDRARLPAAGPEAAMIPGSARPVDAPTPTIEVKGSVAVLKRKVHAGLIEHFDLKRLDLRTLNDPLKIRQLRERAEKVALELMAQEGGFVEGAENRQRLVKEILDEALGLGPLEDLLMDETISDILVNGKDLIYIERSGRLLLTDKKFTSNEQLLTIIERIIAPLGRRIDESTPMVDARLPDGSRVNAIIPPLSLKGPMLSIRKFSRERYTMDDLIRFQTLDRRMADFLGVCVKGRKNMIVSGGTGSGKTTFLNVLSSFLPNHERIVTIEDAAELRLHQEHWVPLEAKPPNVEGKGAITMRQLFRNALRMRPDRIVIGECRGDETMDMLQAMNTGHDGSLTTLHANSPQDVFSRLDSLVLMSNIDLPVRAVREQIASAIHLIVHTARLSDGSRKVTHITEVTGITEQTDIRFNDLFVFRQEGVGPCGEVIGSFRATGHLPTFLHEMKTRGFLIAEAMFSPDDPAR